MRTYLRTLFEPRARRQLRTAPGLNAIASRRGYAMGLFLVVLTVMTTTVIMLLSIAATEARNAAELNDLTKARALANSALDDFYGRLQTTPDLLDDLGVTSTLPILADTVPPGSSTQPWHYTERGARVRCTDTSGVEDLFRPCYYLEVAVVTPVGETRPDALEVTANVRYSCRGDIGRCRTVTFEQRIRPWQFTDFLFYTQYNVVSPSLRTLFPSRSTLNANGTDPCAVPASTRSDAASQQSCPSVAYTDNDKVTGPVYTADDFVVVCGNPAGIFVGGAGGQTRVYARAVNGQVLRSAADLRGDTCPSFSPTGYGTTLSSVLRLPPGRTTFTQAENRATASGSALRPSGKATLEFSGNEVIVSGATPGRLTLGPSLKVITVDGDVELKGSIDGRVTVFASGDVTIVDDLTYLDKSPNTGLGDVLGVNAIGDIVIEQMAPVTTNCLTKPPAVRRVDALLVSLNGTVRTKTMTEYGTLPLNCVPPTLEFYGAMATKYQGVFGLYRSSSNSVIAGYAKQFSHDDRSARSNVFLPPYLVTPVGLQWIRVDIAEVVKR